MGFVKNEDIIAYCFDDEIIHKECASQEERDNLMQDEIMTGYDLEQSQRSGTRWFCDRCKKEVTL